MSDTETDTEIEAFEPVEAFDESLPPPKFAPGIYADIPEDIYHRSEGVSKSKLAVFAKAPAKALVPVKETSSMRLGKVGHTVLLEPDQFDARFVVAKLDRFDKRTKAFQAAQEAAGDRTLIKPAEYDVARWMRDAAMSMPVVRELLTPDLLIEQSAYWTDAETGLLCRGRMDGIHMRFKAIVDIKTTVDASPFGFAKIASSFRYHWQEAMYTDGVTAAGGWEPDAFVFIAIERERPWLTAHYEIDPEQVEVGRRQIREHLRRYAECVRTNTWPGYSESIERLSLMPWALLEAAA